MRSIILKTWLIISAGILSAPVYLNLSSIKYQTLQNSYHSYEDNPLLMPWDGPYNGIPPFDKVKLEDFKPALESAMQENLNEIEKITSFEGTPGFENIITEFERSGNTLSRVLTIYGIWGSNMNSADFKSIQKEMAPKIAEHNDKIYQNEALFVKIEAVYKSSEFKKLNAEQQRLTWRHYTNFVLAGAKLNAKDKARVAVINQQLASDFTDFSQKLLAEEENFILIEREEDLQGLPDAFIASAAENALSKKLNGWVISNTRSSVDPFLTYSSSRDLREKVWRMFINRGDNNDENDTNVLIEDILQLRAERARILGFKTHAHWRMENTMAKMPEKAMELMDAVWKPALTRVKEEVADMQKVADEESPDIKIEAWDYKYYSEKVRKEKYDLDQDEVKKYLQLDNLRDGMFWVAGELFNFKFSPVTDVPVYHPDVTVWKVTDKITGKLIGLWYFDPYARNGKKSGAWMNAYRRQDKMDGPVTTIVSNNSNFIKGKDGEPVLISWDDAQTLFHEFGHALHGLSSDVTFRTLSGTAVPRDYVEFPSQILERWLSTPQVLNKFALHYETNKPLPKILADRINKSSTFNQGFSTLEYLASAIIDMKLHLADASKINPREFEKNTLKELKMPSELVMRHRTPQFAHIFSSDAYSAGYYSYIWADVMSADAYEVFLKGNGPYDKVTGEKLKRVIFSVGNTIDPSEAYKLFTGHEPDTEALMRTRGFPLKNKKQAVKN